MKKVPGKQPPPALSEAEQAAINEAAAAKKAAMAGKSVKMPTAPSKGAPVKKK